MSRVNEEMAGDYLEVERIEDNLMYVKGHKYPIKGIPTVEKVEKANEIKKAIKHFKSLKNIYIPVCYLVDFAEEIRRLIINLTGDNHIAECIAFVLEYDQAYRFRLQDLFTETTKEALADSPVREILRLAKFHKQREIDNYARSKVRFLFYLLVLYALTHKRKWKQAIQQANFSNLQMDTNDRYWACMKTDYRYFGLSYKQRQRLIKHL